MPDIPEPPRSRPSRRIDARSLRALAHPLRMRILELLALDGPATATGLAKRLGETSGTVSWHLRHLAEHAFIEEDAGRGTKRERWWREIEQSTRLHSEDFRADPENSNALAVYQQELAREFHHAVMDYLTQEWEEPWSGSGLLLRDTAMSMTPEQMRAFTAELSAVVARHARSPGTPPEPGALPVVVQFQVFPRKEQP